MTDWSLPTTASTYANYTTELINRDASLAKQFNSASVSDTNVLTDTVRWNSSSKIWELWSGTAWGALAATYGINVSQLLGSTWAAPGTIGSTTPSTGAFTTLSATSTITSTGGVIKSQGTGSDTVASGPYFGVGAAGVTGGLLQLPASGIGLDVWSNNSGWVKTASFRDTGLAITGTLSATGILTITGDNNITSIGGTAHSVIKAGDTNNDFALHSFQTSAGGTIAVIGAKATTTGAYPNSVGELHLAVQNGASTTDVVTVTAAGLAVTGTGSFNGILTAPTAAAGTDTTQVATTAFVQAASKITIATQQATTSGTSIDFTSIPATVKRITVMFNDVSTNGSSLPIIQIGDSGGIEITGYTGAAGYVSAQEALTSGFKLTTLMASNVVLSGSLTLSLMDSSTNKWMAHGVIARTDSVQVDWCAGYKALSGTLDRIRLTTANGTDAFDAGAINIAYE